MPDILARLQLRAGTATAWASANPVLAAGEPGFETDTKILRIGDGATAFLSLERFQTSDGFAAIYQPLDENLDALSALTFAANKLPYTTGIGSMALADMTPEARVFLAAATKTLQRASLELKTGAMTDTEASDDLSFNPAMIPTRNAVRSAMLKVGGPAKLITYTASATFIKADHGAFPDDHMVLVEAWGGGGGGASGTIGGGGGGALHAHRRLRYADLPASVGVAIGGGGAIGANGGNTTFGALLTAYGGACGVFGNGGGGGGAFSAGSGTNAGVGGGAGSDDVSIPGSNSLWPMCGGGGGAAQVAVAGGAGGKSYFGGGGGGGVASGFPHGAGGQSLFGGSGGAGGLPGIAPGGGGGGNAPGARGEVRVWL